MWNTDGSGTQRIITSSRDKTARVWIDLTPLQRVDDPRLWASTTYCLTIEQRTTLLGISDAAAHADQQVCERRVNEARAAAR